MQILIVEDEAALRVVAVELQIKLEGENASGLEALVARAEAKSQDGLKRLIGQTARLEFKLVDTTASPTDIAQGIAPPGSQIVPYADSAPLSAKPPPPPRSMSARSATWWTG